MYKRLKGALERRVRAGVECVRDESTCGSENVRDAEEYVHKGTLQMNCGGLVRRVRGGLESRGLV